MDSNFDDTELLRRYADEKSEEAFAELVRRHLDLVYSVALRQVGGDVHLAQDVAQVVFTALARKAAALAERPVLGGWLYRTTQFAAIDAVRAESRRRARESEANTMQELTTNSGAEVDWDKLRPTLDQAIGELKDDDRDAVVLRFFEGKSFADIGAKLRLTENAARMRVERALEKMHAALGRRGVTSTTAALAVALANQTGLAAPTGLAASVTGAALAGAASSGGGAMAVLMSITKLQVGLAGALVVAVAAGIVLQGQANEALSVEAAGLRGKTAAITRLRAEKVQLMRMAAEIEELRKDDTELARLHEEALALKRQLADAKGPQKSGGFAAMSLDTGNLEGMISLYEQLGRVLIVREPAVAAIKPRARSPLTQPPKPIEAVLADLRDLLRQKWNVVLEPAADGSLFAKLAGP